MHVLAAFGFLSYLARYVVLGLLHRQAVYSPVRHAVSDYAVGPTKPLATVSSLLAMLGAVFLAGALLLSNVTYHVGAAVMLVGLALLSAMVVFFPTDLEGQRLTGRGVVHYLVAIASFTLSYEVVDTLSGPLGGGLFTVLAWMVTASLVLVVMCLLVRPLRQVFGLVERVFLGSVGVWLLTATLVLVFPALR